MKRLDPLMLEAEAAARGVKVTSDTTLAKYGLDRVAWLTILAEQGWQCPICETVPSTGKYVVDHEHVRGWAKMPDETRALYVRGVTCWTCNRYLLARGISVETAQRVAKYLRRYSARRP